MYARTFARSEKGLRRIDRVDDYAHSRSLVTQEEWPDLLFEHRGADVGVARTDADNALLKASRRRLLLRGGREGVADTGTSNITQPAECPLEKDSANGRDSG